jgi:hypothetical protein
MSLLDLCKKGLSDAFFTHFQCLVTDPDSFGLRDASFILDLFNNETQEDFERKTRELMESVLSLQVINSNTKISTTSLG